MALRKRKAEGKSSGADYYGHWGYIYTAPFFLAFFVFSFIPIINTIRYSFYEYYSMGLISVGPNFVGLSNYIELLKTDLPQYTANTFILWLCSFVPQLVISLILASWLTDAKLHIYGKQFFRVIMYMPGMVMASAWAMMFFTLFSNAGPVNVMLEALGAEVAPVDFLGTVAGMRFLICLMWFLINFGNTTILIIASITGIPRQTIESAYIDGCNHTQTFFYVTIPTLRPVLAYIVITSLISGMQMFDIPQILTNGTGNPNRTSMTLVMYLNRHLMSDNFGMAGAVSVILFIGNGILCFVIYRILNKRDSDTGRGKLYAD